MITLDLSKAKLAEDLGSYKEKVAEIHPPLPMASDTWSGLR